MSPTQIDELVQRIRRTSARVGQHAGSGASWEAQTMEGGNQRYTLKGIKDFVEMKDEIANLAIWTWNLKDYLKAWVESHGEEPQVVEEYVNTNPALCLCADVANYLKHGALLKHRSRQFSKLGEIQYSISNDVRTTITFMAREVIMTPEDANQVEVLLPILDADDNQIAETCSILNASIRLWENFMESRGVAA